MERRNMSATTDYNDHLDGDSLACKPGNIAEGLDFVCSFGMPILGWAFYANGLWCLYLAYTQRRHRKFLARQTRDGVTLPTARRLPTMRSDGTEILSYMEKLLLSMCAGTLGLGAMLRMYGGGTMYPTTHIRGQIGDIITALTIAAWCYNSLLQHRGAMYFKSLIPQPQGTIRNVNNIPNQSFLSLLSIVLDMTQSWLAPVLVIVLCWLLRAGVYTRGWFAFCLFVLQGIFGLRSFTSIVFLRLATLKRVAAMMNKKNGTRAEKQRRHMFLTNKTSSLGLDLVAVLFISVLIPASYLVLGSTFNSRQEAIHYVIHGTCFVVVITMTNVHLHWKFKKSRKMAKTKVSPTVMSGAILLGGSSAVQQSEV